MDKPCTKCEIAPRRSYSSYCGVCAAAYQKAWRLANPERVKASMKRYTDAHPDVMKANVYKWRLANLEHHKAYQRAWHLKNRGKNVVNEADASSSP